MLKTVSSFVNVIGALNYKGTWNASTNTPTLASGVGTKGDYYVVSVAGSTNIDGQTLWGVGDWIVFNGTVWQRVDGGSTGNFTTVDASGAITGASLIPSGNSVPANGMYLPSANTVGFATDTKAAVTIDSNQRVGVGVTAPTTRMQISGGVAIQSGTGTFPTTGLGLEIYVNDSANNFLQSYNRTGGVYMNSNYNALSHSFRISGTEKFLLDSNNNVIVGNGALATNATNGFMYVTGCAGTPTGTPTAITGRAPIVVDTTNNKLYFYSGGAWRDAGP